MTLGERIKKARKLAGYTQLDLAKRLGIKKQTVSQYEHNIVANIPMDKIKIMSEMFGVTPGYLLCLDVSPALPTESDILMALYNECTPEGKKNIIEFAQYQADKCRQSLQTPGK